MLWHGDSPWLPPPLLSLYTQTADFRSQIDSFPPIASFPPLPPSEVLGLPVLRWNTTRLVKSFSLTIHVQQRETTTHLDPTSTLHHSRNGRIMHIPPLSWRSFIKKQMYLYWKKQRTIKITWGPWINLLFICITNELMLLYRCCLWDDLT